MAMRWLNNEEGVSEVFGYIIILGIVITCLTFLTIIGASSIQSSKDNSQLSSVQQAFTVADSRMSKARFSTSIFQEEAFKINDGTMYVNGSYDDSHIIVYGIDGNPIYNGTLGTIKFISDSGEVAYQDGGVWAKYPDGGTIMISPPDFDYNGVTLTLPIMRINGNGSYAYSNGNTLVDINSSGKIDIKYPGDNGYNPIPQGKYINITIKSDYYKAWESYINERTRATAVSNPDKKMVNISLYSGKGRQSGSVDDGFTTKYMDTSEVIPIEIFNFTFYRQNPGNDFWIVYDTRYANNTPTDPRLMISITRTKGHLNKEYAQVVFTYVKGGLTEQFRGYLPLNRKDSDEVLMVNMLNHTQTPVPDEDDPSILAYVMTYESLSPSVTWGTNDAVYDTGFVAGYDNSSDVHNGDYKSAFDVTEHYMRLVATAFPSGPTYVKISEHGYIEPSNFVLQYKSSEDIKYLYITEGTLDVTLNAQ